MKLIVLLGGLMLAGIFGVQTKDSGRPDCPGRIMCPQTGQLVCRDECPTIDPERPDCPGRIECPLTGELVCVDECPLEEDRASSEGAPPTCCQPR